MTVLPNLEQTRLIKACLGQEMSSIDWERIDEASYKLLPLLRGKDAKCDAIHKKVWMQNQIHYQKLLPVLKQLRKPMLLKGMAMILGYYKDFGARVIGDIDVLVPRTEAATSGQLLLQLGFTQTVSRVDLENEEHLSRWHALNFSHNGCMIDLHWSFIQEHSQEVDKLVWEGAEEFGDVYLPAPTDLLFQTCLHGIKHSPVPLIRWIPDAVTILRQREIDWDRFAYMARSAQASLDGALRYLKEEFGAKVPELKSKPLPKLAEKQQGLHAKGYGDLAEWYRYCLNRGYGTLAERLRALPRYLQCTARLKFLWQVPLFALYWIGKRVWRKVS